MPRKPPSLAPPPRWRWKPRPGRSVFGFRYIPRRIAPAFPARKQPGDSPEIDGIDGTLFFDPSGDRIFFLDIGRSPRIPPAAASAQAPTIPGIPPRPLQDTRPLGSELIGEIGITLLLRPKH